MTEYELIEKIYNEASNRIASPEQRLFRILDMIKKAKPELSKND
tara:strand:- start:678 stop:809 length:132 start_codon:yes stop_codon:yes gene_type:complete